MRRRIDDVSGIRGIPRRLAGTVGAGLLLSAAACGSFDREPPLLACTGRSAPPSDPVRATDTLEVVVALPRRSDPLDLLVRVDSLDEAEGIIGFSGTPAPTAAGAGVTLTTRAIFTVCVAEAPRALVFQGDEVPHGKGWVRVSTDRPVKAVVRIGGDDGFTLEPAVRVGPGESERRRWTMPGEAP